MRVSPFPLGQDLAPALSQLTGQPIYPITAKPARRKVNPPNDTWVAWSANKRGYKMLPHFQVGLSIPAAEAIRLGAGFADLARDEMTRVLPVYQLAY